MADINQPNNFLDDVAIAYRVNPVVDGSAEESAANKTTAEALYSDSGNSIVAKIITKTGTYLHLKWLRNGKKMGQYKSRNFVQDDVITALEYQKANGALAQSPGATLALTIDDSTILIGGTAQLTAVLTRVDATTTDVTTKATYTNDGTNNISVTQAGVVTGVEGNVKATVTLTASDVFTADETITLGNKVYTIKDTVTTVANTVLKGASAAATLDNLKSAVNGTAGSGTTYGSATVAHTQLDATTNTDTTQLFVAKLGGTTANAYVSTETCTNAAFGAVTLTGGTAKTVVITATYGGVAGTRSTTID